MRSPLTADSPVPQGADNQGRHSHNNHNNNPHRLPRPHSSRPDRLSTHHFNNHNNQHYHLHHSLLFCHPSHSFLKYFLLISSTLLFTKIYADSGGTNNGEEQVTIKGVSGQSASLPCFIDEANCGAIYFLTWSKLDRPDRWSRIYVYSDDNVNKPLSSLAGRARFSMQKSEAQLLINTLKPSDEALYKCDVTYVAGKCPSLTYVQLQIIAKPTRSWIEHEGDLMSNGRRLSLTEGDFLKLACSVHGGKPKPTITWRAIDSRGREKILKQSTSNDLSLSPSSGGVPLLDMSDDGTITSTLILNKKLTRDDLNSTIECHVEHEAIKANALDSHVVVDVNVGIKTMEIIGPSTSVREGDVAVIECVAYGSKPAAEIVWRNGSKIIDSRLTSTSHEANYDRTTVNTRSKLEIVITHQDHLNPITCEAANVAMRTPINKSTEISVLFAPIVVMEPQAGLTVNESTPMVSISCSYNANPSTLLVNETVWYKDGRVMDISNTSHYISNFAGHPILSILDVSRADTGHYYCTMANQLGSGVPETSVFMNVLYPTTVKLVVYPNPSSDFLIKEGDNLRMVCDIEDGNPRNASRMRWLKNNGETVSELDSDTSSQKELTWMSITRSLSGNYTCQAVSDAGFSKPSNEVEIVVSYPPGKSIISLVSEPYPIKGENLTLECIVNDPGRPSDKTEYHWENSDGMIFESRQRVLNIANVRLANRGNVSCAAVNQVGFGNRGHFELIPYAPPRFINQLPTTIGVNENFRSNYDSDHINSHRQTGEQPGETYHYDYSPSDPSSPLHPNNNSSQETISAYCRVECFPLCGVNWYRNDQLIDNSTSEFQIKNVQIPEEFLLNRFPSVLSTLTWNMTAIGKLDRVRDSGVIYSCVSSDNLVGPSVRSDTKFQVEYPPENLRLSSTRIDVIENEMLPEIRCDSDALPPATYRWISNSFYDKFTSTIADTPTLTLNRSILRDSAGTYTCIASNIHGARRIDLQMNVLYSPSCTIYESRAGKDNQDVVLICETTSSNPDTGLEFNWSLNGTHLNETFINDISIQEGLKSKIIISTIDDSLFGTWTCSIRNTVGQTNPNCTLIVDTPIAVAEWSALSDESIFILSLVIVLIIAVFVFVLLCLIYLMRRRRHKNDKEKRENPDGSRSPTPSSSTSRVSSNQNDLISTKSQASSKKTTDTERLSSTTTNSSALGNVTSGEMYENMTFHRKPSNCMSHLPNGIASYYQHTPHPIQTQSLLSGNSPVSSTLARNGNSSSSPVSPPPPPTYDTATNVGSKLLNGEFRRTQSARFPSNQTITGPANIYSICNDPSQSLIYADLQLAKASSKSNGAPIPPVKPLKSANSLVHQPSSLQSYNHTPHHPASHPYHQMVYQQLGTARTLHYPHSCSNANQPISGHTNNNNHQTSHSSSSNSSTPPSLSTSSTNSNTHYPAHNGNNDSNHSGVNLNNSSNNGGGSSTLNPSHFMHHTYDRPDVVQKQAQSYFQRVQSSFGGVHLGTADRKQRANIHSPIVNNGGNHSNTSSTSNASSSRSQLYRAGSGPEQPGTIAIGPGGIAHCEYAILRFDHPPSPPSQC